MTTLQEIGELHLKTESFRRKLERAKDFVRTAFASCQKPYLGLSGGKDSVAMLGVVNDIAEGQRRQFRLFAHVSDASFPGTIETIKECADKTGRKLYLDESPVSAFSVRRKKIKFLGKEGYFFDSIKNFALAEKTDLAFVGVRAKESKRREKACVANGFLFSSKTIVPQMVCYPLIWFSVEDVCAAIVHYKLPFHPIYLKQHPTGDARNIRLGYLTARDLMHKGTVAFIKQNYPEQWNKLRQAFPEMTAYV